MISDRYDIETATTTSDALRIFGSVDIDAVLLDIDLGRGTDGFGILERIRESSPDLPVIMVTQDSSAASAVAALKKGATDYIDKNPDISVLEKRISTALDLVRLTAINRVLRDDLTERTGPMIGESEAMVDLRREIEHAAETPSPVLIVGETGTGKELVAREVHALSRPAAPFVALNCAAIPRDLFEARLFGSERGAYTGADRTVQGAFEIASDGVLFLDEITEIETSLQAKLLRVIEEREFERVGGSKKRQFRGKILA
ncbi:MAG: sigma 54-interacting transcriptional regulator, partial [Candidatus Krumholzibacteria bacterium]|nr:sigma 54-interacting transcriptional regulator [Candidatus Krumholzibacteria bacterium]